MNPLIPGVWDVVWSMVWIAALVLAVVAMVTLLRTKAALGPAATALWALAIIFIPLLGAFVWLMSSRRLRRTEARRRRTAARAEAA
ncbi:PLDc N-terminal domain-containing protein [Microbacterium sp. SA39]|uniref:PLDc N-terminal domain-containing protein n=1 Tax=Microbacterium sp. SA39 TaxID=1263625 RepID=UPI0005F9E64E|nr:PLDc N-terminal domain-containing protein [Microbacterium sp. SA39]KJQ54373.1 hypothetical protein RS85_01975 [Microbacterium sp. SA39]